MEAEPPEDEWYVGNTHAQKDGERREGFFHKPLLVASTTGISRLAVLRQGLEGPSSFLGSPACHARGLMLSWDFGGEIRSHPGTRKVRRSCVHKSIH